MALLYVFLFSPRWSRAGRDVWAVNSVLYLYLAFVLFFTLMPILTSIPFVLNHPYGSMNTIPFVDVLNGRGDFVRQVLLNVLLMMPFGFLFPLTRTGRQRFGRTALACFLLSLAIELLQPLLDGTRSSDVTDLITNTLGGVIGYAFFLLLRPVTGWILRRLRGREQ